MRVGFLPVIPRPITDPATVRQLCTNFENVRKQLNQPTLPVWNDEGVFDILIDVLLANPADFKKLFPGMGPFHWAKVLQRCSGKLVRGSGLEDAFVECGVFGPGAIETVLTGKHYYRSLAGFLMLDDLITYMQWNAFWLTHKRENYPFLPQLQNLAEKLSKNQAEVNEFSAAIEHIQPLYEDFNRFKKECEEKSQVCEYLLL